jgi:hypothetical protein
VQKLSVEFQLFNEFFTISKTESLDQISSGINVLNDHLKSLSGVLYVQMRPLIIKETEMDSLCDAINVLYYEVLEEQVYPRGESAAAVIPVIERLLEDLQERLVYVSQLFIRDRIAIKPQKRANAPADKKDDEDMSDHRMVFH